jgi:hypothetical protein
MKACSENIGKVFAEMKTKIDRTRAILQQYESARNDDAKLCAIYMNKFCGLGWVDEDIVRAMAEVIETIPRSRRKVQNEEGLYPPTDPEVIERRGLRQEDMRIVMQEL